jgi:hypothetical protein
VASDGYERGEASEMASDRISDLNKRIEKLRGALGLIVTQSPTLAMAQALAREGLKRDDEASR